MAKSTNVVDMDAMYRAGYSGTRDVSGDKDTQVAFMDKVLGKALTAV